MIAAAQGALGGAMWIGGIGMFLVMPCIIVWFYWTVLIGTIEVWTTNQHQHSTWNRIQGTALSIATTIPVIMISGFIILILTGPHGV